jgi:hypothetical protein
VLPGGLGLRRSRNTASRLRPSPKSPAYARSLFKASPKPARTCFLSFLR